MILAIDTTTAWGSVALVSASGEDLGEVRLRTEGGHSRTVLPAVEFLLGVRGVDPLDVAAYAVAVGPGSFTGLRVGISTVQGLSIASGRPCVPVSTLDALAERMRGTSSCLVPMIDAFRSEVFGALYDGEAHILERGRAEPPAQFLARVPPGAAFLGDGAVKYRDVVTSACPGAVFPDRSLYLAATVARLAGPRLAAGETVRGTDLRPVYLRDADIWRPAGAQAT